MTKEEFESVWAKAYKAGYDAAVNEHFVKPTPYTPTKQDWIPTKDIQITC